MNLQHWICDGGKFSLEPTNDSWNGGLSPHITRGFIKFIEEAELNKIQQVLTVQFKFEQNRNTSNEDAPEDYVAETSRTDSASSIA
jgi:hypothetical protein